MAKLLKVLKWFVFSVSTRASARNPTFVDSLFAVCERRVSCVDYTTRFLAVREVSRQF